MYPLHTFIESKVPVTSFPPVEKAHSSGALAVGGDLEVDSLLLAYRNGIFPWPPDDQSLVWFSPPKRAVLFFENFHISRSLERTLKKRAFNFRVNSNFAAVITACREREETWITDTMVEGYIQLHKAGYAISFEAYQDQTLVGGLYGVSIARLFAAESMFYRVDDASKAALCFAVEYLKERGTNWIDCQVLNPHSERLGAVEISRKRYMELLKKALE